jgi:3-deoxy-D-manno-octulosonic-acid transferase
MVTDTRVPVTAAPVTTVAIISYNYGRYLREAVTSVLRQTRRPRILVMDDASTDETPAVMAAIMAEAGHAVRYVRAESNQGLARTRNAVAALVDTEWVVYLDADDWMGPHFIERGEALLARHPELDALTTDMYVIRQGRRWRTFKSRVPRAWAGLLRSNTVVQTSFIRRSVLRDLGGYDPTLDFEDWDFWIRLLKCNYRLGRLRGIHVYRREHGANKSKLADERIATKQIRDRHPTGKAPECTGAFRIGQEGRTDAGRGHTVARRPKTFTFSAARWLYSWATELIVWGVLTPFHLVAILRRRGTWPDLNQRLGGAPRLPRDRRLIVHGVSAGEVKSACAFVKAFATESPDWSVVITTGTRDGHRMAVALQRSIPAIEAVCFLPWDRRRAVERWLRAIAPGAVVIVEPEIWPNLYLACERLKVPLILVSARLHPRDVARYRIVRPFMAEVLRVAAWIGAQTTIDAEALVHIGAPRDTVVVSGRLKFDAPDDVPSDAQRVLGAVDQLGSPRPMTVVAGSTHAPEERWMLSAFARLRQRFAGLRLVVAPRHVSRAAAVRALAQRNGYRVWCLSEPPSGAPAADVWVADQMGCLLHLYAVADVAFVGGTLTSKGGHNVLEPASRGVAIVVGPDVTNISDVVADLEAGGGILRLREATPSALVEALSRLLSDSAVRAEMGQRALAYCRANRGPACTYARAVTSVVTEHVGAVARR